MLPRFSVMQGLSGLAVSLLVPSLPLLAVPTVGNLTVTQNDTGNTTTSVSGVISQSNGATFLASTRGDFALRFDGATPADDLANGILMVSLRENGRSNQGTTPTAIGAGLGYAIPQIQTPATLGALTHGGFTTAINIGNTAISGVTTGGEWNTNQSFAYFKYSGWLGGWVNNSVDDGPLTGFLSSSAGFTVASGTTDPATATVFDNTGTAGIYTLRLGGLSALRGTSSAVAATSQNGILLVTGGKNEDNYALSAANADGTFTLICHDNGVDAVAFENDPVAFVYVPTGHSEVAAMGRIDAEGDAAANSGTFTVTKGGTGQWYLSVPGFNDSNSVLIISPEGAAVAGGSRVDNLWSFAWDAANSRWVIEGRDINASATTDPVLQNLQTNEPAFSFVVLPRNLASPTVSLDSPAGGSFFTVGSPITLTATAADDSSVAKVEFFDGATLLGEDTTAPYSFAWNGAALGSHNLTARAIDNYGAATVSPVSTITVTPPAGTDGLYFDGANDHVTFGDNPALKLATFTLECWFKREAGGVGTSTGTGGVIAYPLISKGRSENDGSNVDCNYFLGIEVSSGKLAADFEDLSTGLNHPAVGQTVIPTGVWQHAAVTFDGTSWTLYLNGKIETVVSTEGQVPRNDSIQHAGLGTALNSGGTPSGYFHGQLDEVRIWNNPRDLSQIQSTLNSQLPTASGLVARWAMNEPSGNTILSSAGATVTGSLVNGVFRTGGAPFNLDVPPSIALVSPANNAIEVPVNTTLSAVPTDLNGGNVQVKFFGRSVGNASDTNDFTVIALPDTQFYSQNTGGNRAAIFSAQTDWIVAEHDAQNIGFVLHLGDLVNNGDDPAYADSQWAIATGAMYRLENSVTTGLAEGVPYVVSVGNHDQTPIGSADGTTTYFNTYFGVHPATGINHFAGKSYYGETSEPTSADNHYTLFSAGGLDFIVISLEYDTTPDQADLDWADAMLKAHPTRRGIVISHWMVNTGNPATFSPMGAALYESLKDNPNLILMHGGHVHGEGRRTDAFEGRTVHSILADYQSRTNGGDGWLRIMKFRPSLNRIEVQTYSPSLNQYETDDDSQFTIDVNLAGGVGPFTELGTVTVAAGSTANFDWSGLEQGGRYEWYAEVSDGATTIVSPVRSFLTEGAVFAPSVAITSPANGTSYAAPATISVEAAATDSDGSVAKVEFYSGTTLLGEDTTAPYSFTWSNVPAGSYTVIAKATDNEGEVSSSTAISVVVLTEPAAGNTAAISTGLFNPNWVVAGTSPAPRQFITPGVDEGDLALNVNGTPVSFLSGVVAATNWENAASVSNPTDNLLSPYADGSGNAMVSVMDNSNNNAADANPTTVEQSAGTAVAMFPFASGFTGALVAADGTVLASNFPAGVNVAKLGTGLYSLSGLSLAGNLLAFTNGNGGDNVPSIRSSNGVWIIEIRDNDALAQDNPFSFVYLPGTTSGVLSGKIQAGNGVPLNDKLAALGLTVTATAGYYEITFGDGTVINPANTALFLTADSTTNAQGVDNLLSYSSNGNAFRVFTQDLPEITGAFEAIDLRFVAIPLDLQPPAVPLVTIAATDATAGEFGDDQALAFTVTRTGSTGTSLDVGYSVSGVTPGSDIAALSGNVQIPAGQLSAIIPVTVLADDVAEGDEILTLSITDAAAYDPGTPAAANATIADRPFQAFLHANGLTDPAADNDGDGVPNSLEYYHGTAGNSSASRSTIKALSGGNGTFTATFPHAKGATDVTTAIQWSTDLAQWRTSGQSNGSQAATIATQLMSPPEADPETLHAVLTISSGPVPSHIFLRLVVTP